MDPIGAIPQPTTRGQTVAVEESDIDHSVRMLAEEEGVRRAQRSQDVTRPGSFTGAFADHRYGCCGARLTDLRLLLL